MSARTCCIWISTNKIEPTPHAKQPQRFYSSLSNRRLAPWHSRQKHFFRILRVGCPSIREGVAAPPPPIKRKSLNQPEKFICRARISWAETFLGALLCRFLPLGGWSKSDLKKTFNFLLRMASLCLLTCVILQWHSVQFFLWSHAGPLPRFESHGLCCPAPLYERFADVCHCENCRDHQHTGTQKGSLEHDFCLRPSTEYLHSPDNAIDSISWGSIASVSSRPRFPHSTPATVHTTIQQLVDIDTYRVSSEKRADNSKSTCKKYQVISQNKTIHIFPIWSCFSTAKQGHVFQTVCFNKTFLFPLNENTNHARQPWAISWKASASFVQCVFVFIAFQSSVYFGYWQLIPFIHAESRGTRTGRIWSRKRARKCFAVCALSDADPIVDDNFWLLIMQSSFGRCDKVNSSFLHWNGLNVVQKECVRGNFVAIFLGLQKCLLAVTFIGQT